VVEIAGNAFLVTGGANLIGSHIADVLLKAGAREVRLYDNLAFGSSDPIKHLEGDARVKVIRGDVLRLNQMIDAATGVSGIFSLAAFLTLPMAANPALGVEVNTMGMVNTLEAARLTGVKRVILSSSIAVYGAVEADVITEDAPFITKGASPPFQLYSATKLLGEALCAQYHKLHGVEFNSMRFSSVYGERQHARAVNANYIADVYDRVNRGEPPVIIGDGSEVHDYIYVTDVAEACVAGMASKIHGKTFNTVTGVDTTHTRVAEIVIDVCNAKHLKPEYKPDTRAVTASASAHLGLSRARAERELPWVPKVSIEDGIRRYIAWRREQKA
jgi:UDP-glucose 4-epimerase